MLEDFLSDCGEIGHGINSEVLLLLKTGLASNVLLIECSKKHKKNHSICLVR